MVKYIVRRLGSNQANQPMCDCAVVAVLDAKNGDHAKQAALEHNTVYANQYLTVIAWSRANKATRDEAAELTILVTAYCPECGAETQVEKWMAPNGFYFCSEHA